MPWPPFSPDSLTSLSSSGTPRCRRRPSHGAAGCRPLQHLRQDRGPPRPEMVRPAPARRLAPPSASSPSRRCRVRHPRLRAAASVVPLDCCLQSPVSSSQRRPSCLAFSHPVLLLSPSQCLSLLHRNTDAPNQHHGDATITSSTGSPSLRHPAAGSARSGRFPPGAALNPCLLRCRSSSARCSSAASSA